MNHHETIVDQFTKQAVPFSELHAGTNEKAMACLVATARPEPDDTVLDVACGPGLVACDLAPGVRHVNGIDLTPAMIKLARKRQRERSLTNLAWHVGDGEHLPYGDGSFSLVLTRYSLHHFLRPVTVLNEMARVCTIDGKVAVIDVVVEPEKADAYNRKEKLRDPSHIRALTRNEFGELAGRAGLRLEDTATYSLVVGLTQTLSASFPKPGDEERLRRMVSEDVGVDRLGVGAYWRDGEVHYKVPIGVFVYRRACRHGPDGPGGAGSPQRWERLRRSRDEPHGGDKAARGGAWIQEGRR